LYEALAKVPKVKLRAPKALSAGLVCFEVDGLSPEDVVKRRLARKIVASDTPYAVPRAPDAEPAQHARRGRSHRRRDRGALPAASSARLASQLCRGARPAGRPR
jgi:selenocysteine lyase/cysteine desulfurase